MKNRELIACQGKRPSSRWATGVLLPLLTGCSFIPVYERPALPTAVSCLGSGRRSRATGTVETASEREKLVFRVRAQIPPELLRKHITRVKTGLPGMAYVRLDPRVDWPPELQTRLPQ